MSEVKTMSSIQFPNTQQPYQVNDERIPANPGAYKYMATDGEGNWVSEDRLAYKEDSTLFQWDGDRTGLEETNYVDMNIRFVGPISLPGVLDSSWLSGLTIIGHEYVVPNGKAVIQPDNIYSTGNNSFYVKFTDKHFSALVYVTEDDEDTDLDVGAYSGMKATFPSAGLWLYQYATSAQSWWVGNQTIHPIPAEYLPDTVFESHGDLPDADLDEVTALGYYNLTTSYTYTNTPDSLTNGALLVFSSGASRVQLFMGKAAGSGLYTRRYIGGAWKDWVAYATKDELESASGGGGGKTVVYYAHMASTSDGTDLYRDPEGLENVTCADIDELDLTQDRIYIRELELNGMDFSVVENSGTYANAFKRFGASGDNPAFWMFLVLYKSSSDPTAEAETLSLYTDGMYSVLR